jgi:hypothetical protein
VVLLIEQLNLTFYLDLRTYVIDELSQSVNIFDKHINRLKVSLA